MRFKWRLSSSIDETLFIRAIDLPRGAPIATRRATSAVRTPRRRCADVHDAVGTGVFAPRG
jgi:hypothetical protein